MQVHDLIGNVHEWCIDSYFPYNGYSPDRFNSAILYNNFHARKKVLKGGSFASSSYFLSPQNRLGCFPEDRITINGFRVVKEIVKKKPIIPGLSKEKEELISDFIKRELILKEFRSN